jgi:hypothetical protein
METDPIVAFCAGCDAPLRAGMKLNEYPCPEHPDCVELYCDRCVAEAEARLDARKRS